VNTNPIPGKLLARGTGIVLLSLLSAIVIIVGLIVAREWRGGIMGDTFHTTTTQSEEEKLHMLALLAATSTPSMEDRLKILKVLHEQQ